MVESKEEVEVQEVEVEEVVERKFKWPPLESDPAIFTEFMQRMGLPYDWGFNEVYGFDEDLLSMCIQPVLAILVSLDYKGPQKEKGDENVKTQFYMKQTKELDNACGIIGALHAIFNNVSPDKIMLNPESVLSTYHDMCSGQTPAECATHLENYNGFKKEYQKTSDKGQSKQASEQN